MKGILKFVGLLMGGVIGLFILAYFAWMIFGKNIESLGDGWGDFKNYVLVVKYIFFAFCIFYWRETCRTLAKWRGRPELEETLYKGWPIFAVMVVIIEITGMLL